MTQFAIANVGVNAGWLEGQDGWKAGMDQSLITLGFLNRGIVQNATTLDLPGAPTVGLDCFIVGSPAVGDLLGLEDYIVFYGEQWYYLAPWEGAKMYNQATDQYMEYRGGAWVENSNYKLKVKDIAGTSYTVVAGDSGYILNFTSATAVALTVDSLAGAAGFNFGIVQSGAGQITIGGSATFVNVDGHTKTFGLGAQVAFIGLGAGVVNYAGRTAL